MDVGHKVSEYDLGCVGLCILIKGSFFERVRPGQFFLTCCVGADWMSAHRHGVHVLGAGPVVGWEDFGPKGKLN